jgi:dihydroflavonol-4-reductase
MRNVFVTGATGFIGGHLAELLLQKGCVVTCLARDPQRIGRLADLPVRIVEGDIRDRRRVAQVIGGHEWVFHLASWFQIGVPRSAEAEMRDTNVGGTQCVLEEAWKAGASRIVYGSTVGALGSSGPLGRVADEAQLHDGRFQCLYVKTKHEAHRAARALIRDGAPVTIVMPEAVYGPGDRGIVAQQMALLMAGKMTAIPDVSGVYCYTHVHDTVDGYWRAAEHGRLGREYILAGQALTLAEFYEAVARRAGVAAPARRIPVRVLLAMAWAAEIVPGVQSLTAGRPIHREAISMIAHANWHFSAERAKTELGWSARPFEDGLDETLAWIRSSVSPAPCAIRSRGHAV